MISLMISLIILGKRPGGRGSKFYYYYFWEQQQTFILKIFVKHGTR